MIYKYGRRSSVGRASGCGSEGRGFEPRRLPHVFLMFDIIFFAILSFVIFNKIKNNLGKTDEIERRESIKKFIKENINQTKQQNFLK